MPSEYVCHGAEPPPSIAARLTRCLEQRHHGGARRRPQLSRHRSPGPGAEPQAAARAPASRSCRRLFKRSGAIIIASSTAEDEK